jgi:hypothetical protein
MFGGCSDDKTNVMNDLWSFDFAAKTWRYVVLNVFLFFFFFDFLLLLSLSAVAFFSALLSDVSSLAHHYA